MQDQTYQVYKTAGPRYQLLIQSKSPPLNSKKGCYPSTAGHTRSPETRKLCQTCGMPSYASACSYHAYAFPEVYSYPSSGAQHPS